MTDPATLDAFVDSQVAALLALCKAAVNANVPTATPSTVPTIQTTYGWPAKQKLSAAEFPALLIYRISEETLPRTLKHLEARVTFAFEYVMSPTPLERVDLRWRLPPLVWKELVRVVAKGHDPSYSSDSRVLKAAGFVWVDETKRRVDYAKPVEGRDVQPGFLGTMVLHHRDEIDTSALEDLLSLDAQYRLVNGDGADELLEGEQPLVEQILTSS